MNDVFTNEFEKFIVQELICIYKLKMETCVMTTGHARQLIVREVNMLIGCKHCCGLWAALAFAIVNVIGSI